MQIHRIHTDHSVLKNGYLHVIWFFIFFGISACSLSAPLALDTNQLGKSANPALQVYANSPVMWNEWSDEILSTAAEQNKLLFISIGFSSCHWCHVMERETFSDSTLAKYLNQHFVCIRIDKEELPDVDRVYQEYASITDQNTGWPMNVVAAANGTPVYSRTYISSSELLEKLKYFHELNQNHNGDFLSYAEAVRSIINNTQLPLSDPHFGFTSPDSLLKQLDHIEGGVIGTNKFLHCPLLNFLLSSSDTLLNQHALLSINKILSGGIYDHVGGGVHRYTTDAQWRFPHWEKTLSDNAQFISNLCRAYHLTHNELYLTRAIETAQFVMDNLAMEDGLFANSLDSESSGQEGSYYLWSYDELKNILGDKFSDFCLVFDISEKGNLSLNQNALFLKKTVNPLYFDPNPNLLNCLQILRRERQKRVAPLRDEKATISYNSLFAEACLDLFVATNNEDYLYRAQVIMEEIKNLTRTTPYRLPHAAVQGTILSKGILDDYAHYIKSLITLYQTTGDEKFLLRAEAYAGYVCTHFTSGNSIWFQLSKNDVEHTFELIEKEDDDCASSNAIMAENLYTLGRYFGNEKWTNRSRDLSLNMAEQTYRYPVQHSSWSFLQSILSRPECDLVFTGERALGLALEFKRKYNDYSTITYASPETEIPLAENKYTAKENLIYVCINRTCKMPVKTVEEAIAQIDILLKK